MLIRIDARCGLHQDSSKKRKAKAIGNLYDKVVREFRTTALVTSATRDFAGILKVHLIRSSSGEIKEEASNGTSLAEDVWSE